jgi:hypothetical protein
MQTYQGIESPSNPSIPNSRPRDPPPTPPISVCTSASEWSPYPTGDNRHAASHTLALSPDADILQLISLSSFRGTVTIIGYHGIEQALVDFIGVWTSRDELVRTEVCMFENATGLSFQVSDEPAAYSFHS